ncbi:MAG: SOS response-associated peptidase family protein [Kofleriaceae bacterium]
MERYTLAGASRFNIGHGQRAPVELRDGTRDLRWGLLAPWRGHGGKRGPMTFAADLATIEATAFLRTARTRRRCLVLADGFYAWRAKQPFWIRAPARIAFAGLAATHADDHVESFAVVLLPATGIVAAITGVMPAIVDERWLDSAVLAPLDLAGWRADPVSTRVDDLGHDDVACIAPLAQGQLF